MIQLPDELGLILGLALLALVDNKPQACLLWLGLALLVALANAQVRGADAASLLASQARGIEWGTALSALLALVGAALALRLRREEPAALQPSRG
ncbi:hypothetical protein KQ718_15750, partial [Listeria monocytogenes]|nr:hypothetical protein [Listeria monocytogenes]